MEDTKNDYESYVWKVNCFFLILWKKKVDQVLDAWNKNSSEGCFSVGDDIQKMTLDVLGLCIFGKDFNFFLEE